MTPSDAFLGLALFYIATIGACLIGPAWLYRWVQRAESEIKKVLPEDEE